MGVMGEKLFPQFPFVGGIDQKTEQSFLEPSNRQFSISNGNFVKVGAIDKRYGVSYAPEIAVGNYSSPTYGLRAFSWNRANLNLVGGSQALTTGTVFPATSPTLYSYGSDLIGVGYLPTCYPLRRPVNVSTGLIPPVVFDFPQAAGNTLRIALSLPQTGNGVYGTVYDADSGSILLEPTLIYTFPGSTQPLIVNGFFLPGATLNRQAMMVFQDSTGVLWGSVFNISTLVFSTPVQITPTVTGTVTSYDVVPMTNDPAGGFLVAWNSVSGSTASVSVQYFSNLFVAGTVSSVSLGTQYTFSGPIFCTGIYGQSVSISYVTTLSAVNRIRTEWFSGNSSLFFVGDTVSATGAANLSYLTGSVAFDTSVVSGVGTGALFISYGSTITSPLPAASGQTFVGGWVLVDETTPVGSIANGVMPAGFAPVMRPFIANGLPHQVTVYLNTYDFSGESAFTSEQMTLYLLGWQPSSTSYFTGPNVVATMAKNIVSSQGLLSQQENYGNRLNLMSQGMLANSGVGTSVSTRFACGVNTLGIDFAAISQSQGPSFTAEFFFDQQHLQQLYVAQELGSELHIGGAVPFVCDSQIACEDNFFFYPEWSSVALTNAGAGNAVLSGQYLYAANYAYPDAAGLIHRSAPYFFQAVSPTTATASVYTGDANITTGVFGLQGSINPPAIVTGTTNISGSGTYGIDGTLGAPIIKGGTSVNTSSVWGGVNTLTLAVDSESTLNSITGPWASLAAMLAAIEAQWPQLTASTDSLGRLILSSSSRGPAAVIAVNAPVSGGDAFGFFPPGYSPGVGTVFVFASPSNTFTGYTGVPMGTNGGMDITGTAATFTDRIANDFTAGFNGIGLFMIGSQNPTNNGIWSQTWLSNNTVTVTNGPTTNTPLQDAQENVVWGIGGSPCVRTLTIATNGGTPVVLALTPAIIASQSTLLSAIGNAFGGLSATVNGSGNLVLTSKNTGPSASITVYADTANQLLGLTAGTTTGTTSTLILTINGGSPDNITLNNTTNAASLSAFEAYMNVFAGNFGVTTSSGNLEIFTTGTGSLTSISIGAGTANAALGIGNSGASYVHGTNGTSPVLTMPALSSTWRPSGSVYLEIFRTLSNGSNFYMLDRIVANPAGNPLTITWPSSGYDITTDLALDTSTLQYTTGGVLPNINPPSFLLQISHNSRIVGVDETLQQVWLSQAFSSGTAPGWSGSLVVPFSEGGDITGLASMDGKLLVFKSQSIWVMYGTNGPALTGQGSDWTVPQRIPSNVGAVGWQSIISTDAGVFFQSSGSVPGLYLLGRDLAVTFIGKNVTDTLTSYPTITSAVSVPSANQIRFTCSNGTSNITVAYDYLLQQWTTHSYPYVTYAIQSACTTYQNPQQYSLLDASGKLWQENLPTAAQPWMDFDVSSVAHFVPTVIQTAWIKTELQGYLQALYAQLYTALQSGTNMSGLQIQLAINYNGTIVQTAKWAAAALAKSPNPGQVIMDIAGVNNQAMSYQFTISDVDPGVSGESGQGARFIGLGLSLNKIGPRYPFIPTASKL
jgi:hypothetical protein